MRSLVRILFALVLGATLVQPGRALAYDVGGAIGEEWRKVSRSRVGEPIGREECFLRDRGCFQHFERGSIYWSPATGAHHVLGSIRDLWAGQGWENSFLGYPRTGENCWIREGGCFQHFERGSIYWTRTTGAHEIIGAIRDRWAVLGWESSFLGYPTTGENCWIRDGGCFQHFQGGSMYFTARTGAWPVGGAIRDFWAREGWEASRWGYPLAGESCGDQAGVRVCTQPFQGGTITWRSDRGVVLGVDCAVQKCVALTYDDGPSAHTHRLLDTLARENVRATLFVVGTMVNNNPSALRRATDLGVEVANHSMNHPNLSGLGYSAVRAQIDPVNDRILRHTGRRSAWLRPPYGAGSATVDRAAADTGQGVALWSVDTWDWRDRNAAVVTERVLRDVRPGSVVLMHDLHGTTVDAAPAIVAGLKRQGYQLVTMTELFGPPVPGRVYRSR